MGIKQVIQINIRKWRKKADLSQEKLSILCGSTPAYIRQIETGNRSPSVKYLEKIASVLGIAPWQLLYEETTTKDESGSISLTEKKIEIKNELINSLSQDIVASVQEKVKSAFEKI